MRPGRFWLHDGILTPAGLLLFTAPVLAGSMAIILVKPRLKNLMLAVLLVAIALAALTKYVR